MKRGYSQCDVLELCGACMKVSVGMPRQHRPSGSGQHACPYTFNWFSMCTAPLSPVYRPLRTILLQLVLHLHQAMLDLVDALAALQHAVSMPVQQLSGSWAWTLMHASGAWAAMLLEVMQLAEATASHVLEPTPASGELVLQQVGMGGKAFGGNLHLLCCAATTSLRGTLCGPGVKVVVGSDSLATGKCRC